MEGLRNETVSERHCKQYMEKKSDPAFYIIAKLIRFILMVAALRIFIPHNTVGLFRRFRRTSHIYYVG
jgi:hypothetical protein